jgi:hypothetical protein
MARKHNVAASPPTRSRRRRSPPATSLSTVEALRRELGSNRTCAVVRVPLDDASAADALLEVVSAFVDGKGPRNGKIEIEHDGDVALFVRVQGLAGASDLEGRDIPPPGRRITDDE